MIKYCIINTSSLNESIINVTLNSNLYSPRLSISGLKCLLKFNENGPCVYEKLGTYHWYNKHEIKQILKTSEWEVSEE